MVEGWVLGEFAERRDCLDNGGVQFGEGDMVVRAK